MQQLAPYFGYAASLLLAISLVVTNSLRFRWLNTFGCIFFIIYGILLNAFPILLTNTILFFINFFYLIKIYRQKEDFDLVEFKSEEKLFQKFLSFYKADINAYFPDFTIEQTNSNLNFMVLRDLVIANIFSANIDADGTAEVAINFTSKKYRDFKTGTYIFEKEKDFLISKGIKRLVYKTVSNKSHEHFLKVMGFVKEQVGDQVCYTKPLLSSPPAGRREM
jgi:hypothetical protein